MAIKLFMLGRPGSGKSRAARILQAMVAERGIPCVHTGDYPFLFEMYMEEVKKGAFTNFAPILPENPQKGFAITPEGFRNNVFGQAVEKLEAQIAELEKQGNIIIINELARDDYQQFFHSLPPEAYKDSHILYFESDLKTCIERIKRRAESDEKDSHLVSEEIMRGYYSKDNWEYMTKEFVHEFGFPQERLLADRNDPLADPTEKIKEYVMQQLITPLNTVEGRIETLKAARKHDPQLATSLNMSAFTPAQLVRFERLLEKENFTVRKMTNERGEVVFEIDANPNRPTRPPERGR